MPGVKPPHKEPTPVPSGNPILRVLQLSDLHVDNDYVVGLEAKCGEPLCCRPPKDIHVCENDFLKHLRLGSFRKPFHKKMSPFQPASGVLSETVMLRIGCLKT